MLVVGLAGFAYSGYVWYTKIFSNTDRIFYGMVDKSLTTDSVTRSISQNDASRSENQAYYISFSPDSAIQSVSKVDQIGQDRQKSSVTTETMGTRTADYVSYKAIQIPSTGADQPDYSKVIGKWAKRDASGDSGQQAQFLNEAIFTFIPFGNFSQENKDKLTTILHEKNVYELNNSKITYEGGRPTLNVDVSINPRGLVETLKEYATITGLGNQDLLDPSQYDNNNSFVVGVKVDMLSRHLKKITYPGDTREETYEAYGLNKNIKLPEQTISVEDLQKQLQ